MRVFLLFALVISSFPMQLRAQDVLSPKELINRVVVSRETINQFVVDIDVTRSQFPVTRVRGATTRRKPAGSFILSTLPFVPVKLHLEYSRLSQHYVSAVKVSDSDVAWQIDGVSQKFAFSGTSTDRLFVTTWRRALPRTIYQTPLNYFDPRSVGLVPFDIFANGESFESCASQLMHRVVETAFVDVSGESVTLRWPDSEAEVVFDRERGYWPSSATFPSLQKGGYESWRVLLTKCDGIWVPGKVEIELVQDGRAAKLVLSHNWAHMNRFSAGGRRAVAELCERFDTEMEELP